MQLAKSIIGFKFEHQLFSLAVFISSSGNGTISWMSVMVIGAGNQ